MNFRKSIFPTLIFTVWLAVGAGAQTVHAIIFADTEDKKIGLACGIDFMKMSNEMQATADYLGYGLEKYYFKGSDFNRSKLTETLEAMRVGKDDVVYFYYTGHGFRYRDQIKLWPRLALGKNGESLYQRDTDLNWVKGQIELKGARVNVVLADCCNSVADATMPPSEAFDENQEVVAKNYQMLFKQFRGTVISSGCKPGQYSYCDPQDGGWYTHLFLNSLHDILEAGPLDPEKAWETILSATTEATASFAERQGNSQIPQFDIGYYGGIFGN